MIKVHPKGMESSNLVKKRVVVVGYGELLALCLIDR